MRSADVFGQCPSSRTERLGIPLDEFPAWACAHLESELASINELARTFRDNEEAAALVRQIDDRIAELKRYWAKR